MPLVSFEKVHLSLDGEPILGGVDLAIEPGDRLIVTGYGGAHLAGLLDLIGGALQPDSGSVVLSGDVRVGTMRLASDLNDSSTVFDAALSGRSELLGLRERLSRLTEQADGGDPRSAAELEKLRQRYDQEAADDIERRATSALESVGFDSSQFDQTVGLLSSGERSRLVLARVLTMDADLLLLEEPTHHLDIRGTEFLERYLDGFPGAAVVVSHDRAFFERFATDLLVLGLDGQVSSQPASLAAYRKSLPLVDTGAGDFPFLEVEHSGKVVFNVKNLRLRPGGQTLLEDVTFQVGRGERIGIIGPVGCGKTTLLKTLAGEQEPETGKLYRGYNALMGLYDQELSGLTTGRTVLEELAALRPDLSDQDLREMAARFLFRGDAVERPVESLSDAEQCRLALVLLVMGHHNVLLLDEPTNGLDLPSRETLEAALAAYPGTLISVSHDRTFLDATAERILSFEGRGLSDEPGRYSELRAAGKVMRDVPLSPKTSSLARKQKKRDAGGSRRPASRGRTQRLAELDQLIASHEVAISALVEKMADPAMALDWEGLEKLSGEKKTLEQEHAAFMAERDQLQEGIDA